MSIECKEADYLINSNLYKTVIDAAKMGLKICVIMSGLPGTGKTTVANCLVKDLTNYNIFTDYFTVDKYFLNKKTGEYKFNPKQLWIFHNCCKKAFKKSNASVKIVDNTNLVPAEYKNYVDHAKDNSYIVILLYTKNTSTNKLYSRNIHGVSGGKINEMRKRQIRYAPNTIGIFLDNKKINSLIKEKFESSIDYYSKNPEFILVEYESNQQISGKFEFELPVGKIIPIEIISGDLEKDYIVLSYDTDDLMKIAQEYDIITKKQYESYDGYYSKLKIKCNPEVIKNTIFCPRISKLFDNNAKQMYINSIIVPIW